MARLPPPCPPLYCRLRLFDRRTRRHPPLWTTFLLAALRICHSRRLPTQRRRRSDPSGTSPTRLQQSEGASSSLSPGPFRDALAAIRRSARRREFPITDAVRLDTSSSIEPCACPSLHLLPPCCPAPPTPCLAARDGSSSPSGTAFERWCFATATRSYCRAATRSP